MNSLLAKAKPLARDLFSLSKLRPQRTSGWEFFFLRLFLAIALAEELSLTTDEFPFVSVDNKGRDETTQTHETGLAHLFDLTWLSNPAYFVPVQWILLIGLGIYVSGFLLPLVLPVLTTLHILIFTLDNSEGNTNHTHQMGSLILLGQTVILLWPWARKLTLLWPWARTKLKLDPNSAPTKSIVRDYAVFYSLVALTGAYVIAGISKVIDSTGLWIWNSPYIGMGMNKTNHQNFYNHLNPAHMDTNFVQVSEFMFGHPWITRAVLGGGLFLELFAFLALRNRLWALGLGLGIWSMHEMINLFMGLNFEQNKFFVLIFMINAPFWIGAGMMWLKGLKGKTIGPPRV
ncbi:MAG: hypothetical protein ACI8UO_002818 [Verrucomicrobiales bacterium]|jgi:hypothetical protein